MSSADDLLWEGHVEQASRRQVDGDREVVAALVPLALLAQGRLEHEGRERVDQRGALGERDELDGRDQSESGMVPAHERLDAAHLA